MMWCRSCKEPTSLVEKGTCPFCDTKLVAMPKKTGVKPRISDDDALVLYRAYKAGHSLRAIGAAIQDRYGFSSQKSAANALHSAFERLHLPRRDKVELMRERNFKHGRYAEDRNSARRYQRLQTGETRGVLCSGVRTQYPNKGAQCKRPALAGSDYCIAHDPARRDEIISTLEKARQSA